MLIVFKNNNIEISDVNGGFIECHVVVLFTTSIFYRKSVTVMIRASRNAEAVLDPGHQVRQILLL
jgi:hypothetical protein